MKLMKPTKQVKLMRKWN